MSPAQKSLMRRHGDFRLSDAGSLEGDVRIELTGHVGAAEKERYDDMSTDDRKEAVLKEVKETLPTAVVTEVRFQGVTDPEKPLVLTYHVQVPDYAERTGERLFVQPAFFQRGQHARFPESNRRYPVYFHYPWAEEDSVAIELPAGFDPDHAEAPGGISGGSTADYKTSLAVAATSHSMTYQRAFSFANDGTVIYPAAVYPALKKLFDSVEQMDGHVVTLKRAKAS
jgi:hypothetical protein